MLVMLIKVNNKIIALHTKIANMVRVIFVFSVRSIYD